MQDSDAGTFVAHPKRERRKVRIRFAYHIKARFREQIVKELHELGLPNLMIAQAEKPYSF
jgi:hypothetical protein